MDWTLFWIVVILTALYRLFKWRHQGRKKRPEHEVCVSTPSEYRMVTQEYRMHYSTWTIPSQEYFPVFTPACVDPSVDALNTRAYQDIVDTLKKKERELL